LANILIVDDDPAVQMTIWLLLERAGQRVTVAGDRLRALALLKAGRFDLLFPDIFMPGMDAGRLSRGGLPEDGGQARRSGELAQAVPPRGAAHGRRRLPPGKQAEDS
jgi:hypothetical protein